MGLSYQEEWTVPFDRCDVKQELLLPAFLSQCLAVSGRQSEALGRSDLFLYREYGLIWVVTDYEMTIDRLPIYNETILIQTEALSYNKYFCQRVFIVSDQQGNRLMELLCSFVLIDYTSRKIVPVPEEVIAPYQSEQVKKLARAPKYTALEDPVCQELAVRYFDLDMNGHVNNSKYLEWMYEALGYDFLISHSPKNIRLRYVKEVAAKSQPQSLLVLQDLTSSHEIRVDGHIHAQAVIEWQAREERA